MARSTKGKRGGPGYAGLITFIVLCLLLIAGYAWLVPQYLKVCNSLDLMHDDIETNIGSVVGKDLNLQSTVRVGRAGRAYDSAYFRKVGEAAAEGVKYPGLEKIVGVQGVDDQGRDSVTRIRNMLNEVSPAPDSLHAYVLYLEAELTQAEMRRDATETARQRAIAERQEALDLAEERRKRMDADRAEAKQALDEASQKYNDRIADMEQLMNQASANAKKAWEDLQATKERFKNEKAALEKRIDRLEQSIVSLREELRAKKPKEVALGEARITNYDLVDGRVIINVGKQDGIENGERFTVLGVGKGNERFPKGEIRIVRVSQLTSTADIMAVEPEQVIMLDDIVYRQKLVEDVK